MYRHFYLKKIKLYKNIDHGIFSDTMLLHIKDTKTPFYNDIHKEQ